MRSSQAESANVRSCPLVALATAADPPLDWQGGRHSRLLVAVCHVGRKKVRKGCFRALFFLISSGTAFAQFELAVFGGGLRSGQFSWGGGASIGQWVEDKVIAQGGVSYHRGTLQLEDLTETVSAGGVQVSSREQFEQSGRILDLMGGAQFSLLRPSESRVAPYVGGGLGLAHFSGKLRYTASSLGFFGRAETPFSDTTFSLHGVFGLRVYGSDTWGIRPEVAFIRYMGWHDNAIRVGVGVYFSRSEK